MSRLVADIDGWFESNKYTFEYGVGNSFEFDAEKNAWNITFEGNSIGIGDKSGLIQLATVIINPGRRVDLRHLSNNAMKPNGFGGVDDLNKESILDLAKSGDGFSIDESKSRGFENIPHGNDIVAAYKALTQQIENIEESGLEFFEKYGKIEGMLEKFAKYVGKKNISLEKFRDEYFLKNILEENKKKNIRSSDASIVSAEAVEKAIRRCVKMLQERLPLLGNYLAKSIKFRFGTACYENTDGKTWKIKF
ncbi:hypothetical protein [Solidesulfovibrio carbinoliphilus]|uniref:hypothetical protein n=1 Tax=Solidesulfovibrio carbinoliphilus TaxID=345370 RepID=UPI0012F49832|nr:hypothetical protein [Solidesulfovibrio carbinoliphilus]